MNPVRTFFKIIGVVWIIAILAIGIGGTYLEHNPEAAGAYALGTMNVDPKANLFKQAGQLAEGVSAARDGIEALREAREDRQGSKGSVEARRKYAAARAAGYGHEAAARSAGLPVESENSITIE
jgi:hypothetical protein